MLTPNVIPFAPMHPEPSEEPAAGPPVDLAAEYETSNVREVIAQIERDLVGMAPVKAAIQDIAAFLLVDRVRSRLGFAADPPGLHMSFTGRPGTGKTTVAVQMASILHRLGYVRSGQMVTANSDDMNGPRVKELVGQALGGVLFIDEAYYLYKAETDRFSGSSTIEILLQAMENHRHDLVVIVAGYKDRMNRFFEANPGLASRVSHHIAFPDYTVPELMGIAHRMLSRQHYRFSAEAEVAFEAGLERAIRLPYFANARSVRNAIDEARMHQANRLFRRRARAICQQELLTIEADDVYGCAVFKRDRQIASYPLTTPANS